MTPMPPRGKRYHSPFQISLTVAVFLFLLASCLLGGTIKYFEANPDLLVGELWLPSILDAVVICLFVMMLGMVLFVQFVDFPLWRRHRRNRFLSRYGDTSACRSFLTEILRLAGAMGYAHTEAAGLGLMSFLESNVLRSSDCTDASDGFACPIEVAAAICTFLFDNVSGRTEWWISRYRVAAKTEPVAAACEVWKESFSHCKGVVVVMLPCEKGLGRWSSNIPVEAKRESEQTK
jgi:hypothetical protein